MKSLPFCLMHIGDLESSFFVNVKFLACSTVIFSKENNLSSDFSRLYLYVGLLMMKGLSQITKRNWGMKKLATFSARGSILKSLDVKCPQLAFQIQSSSLGLVQFLSLKDQLGPNGSLVFQSG